jgi:hypothetical protein
MTAINICYNANSQEIKSALDRIQDWEQVTISKASDPNNPLVQVPRKAFIIAWGNLNCDEYCDLVLTEW